MIHAMGKIFSSELSKDSIGNKPMKAPLLTTWCLCIAASLVIYACTYSGTFDGVILFLSCMPLMLGFIITMMMNHVTGAILAAMVLIGLHGVLILLALKGNWELLLLCTTLGSPLMFLIPLKLISEYFGRKDYERLSTILDTMGSILVIIPVTLSVLFSVFAVCSDLSAGVLDNIIGIGIYLYICAMYFALAIANCESRFSAIVFAIFVSLAAVVSIMGVVLHIIY